MKNVMWKGELEAKILLDTIANKKGLYGIGPLSGLRGEILINDGQIYVSKVLTDSTMEVLQPTNVTAPFFVYAHNTDWQTTSLPNNVRTIADLEKYVDANSQTLRRPFAFKLSGSIQSATIHIQNLAVGTKVSSPKEAHSGQVKYQLGEKEVDIIGFFSTEHQGVFTHHDTYLHLHLITKYKQQMGHLDEVVLGQMQVYLPKM